MSCLSFSALCVRFALLRSALLSALRSPCFVLCSGRGTSPLCSLQWSTLLCVFPVFLLCLSFAQRFRPLCLIFVDHAIGRDPGVPARSCPPRHGLLFALVALMTLSRRRRLLEGMHALCRMLLSVSEALEAESLGTIPRREPTAKAKAVCVC